MLYQNSLFRRQMPQSASAPALSWHQDTAFLGPVSPVWNLWCPLVNCGAEAPGLEVFRLNLSQKLVPPNLPARHEIQGQTCLSELWAWREAFDLILGDQALVNQFQARNFARCAWWPSYGFSPRRFYPDPQAPKNWDLTFIGSLNPNTHRERLQLLSQLAPLGRDFMVCFREQVFAADYPASCSRAEWSLTMPCVVR